MILAILQARTSSSRLPGKVLKTILGKPMLELQLERVRRAKTLDRVVVATSVDPSDDPIEALCARLGVGCFRGSLDDVLDRFYQAALAHKPDVVVRLTGDCPLADPEVIDDAVAFYRAGDYDIVSNTVKPTFPDGHDVWVFPLEALARAWHEADRPADREHVTLYLLRNPDQFRVGSLETDPDRSHLRWTVDDPADFEVVREIYEALYPNNPAFTTADVLDLLEARPELSALNAETQRDEGLARSLEREAAQSAQHAPSCREMLERARRRIPGMTQLLSKRPDQFSDGVWPGYFSRAKGAEIWDLDGNHYIDMSIGGIGATALGYADDDVDAAVIEAIRKGSSSSLNCAEEVELADRLCELHPWAERVRYARTGGEAMAVAVRIARAHTGRDVIAFCGYHGWHDWYLATNLRGDQLKDHLLEGLSPRGVPRGLEGTALPFHYNALNELEAIVAAHGKELAAIVMEPIRNQQPAAGFLEGVRRVADETDVPLVFDEISCGFCMTTGGAHLLFGVNPDIAVFSKALGNGYPIAAIIGKPDVMDAAQSTFISSTNWTERIGPAAALAVIEKHQRYDVPDHLIRIGKRVQKGWRELVKKHGLDIEVGGISPAALLTFPPPAPFACKALFVQLMLERGFLASTVFHAMFAHTDAHVDAYLEAVDAVFAEMAPHIEAGDVEACLRGQPAAPGFQRLT